MAQPSPIIATAISAESTRAEKGRWRHFKSSGSLGLWLLALPFVFYIFVFNYVPLWGWIISFQRYIIGVPLFTNKWVGFRNYVRLFIGASNIGKILINTLAFSFLGILTSPAPMIIAILLNEIQKRKARRIIQTITSLPHFVSMVIVFAVIFSFLSIDDGVINNVLLKIGLIAKPLNILGEKRITWYFITAVSMWKSVGWGAIIYLASISSIDPELYAAAEVDGAGRFLQATHITLPGLLPTYSILLLLNVASFLNGASFDMVFLFYNPLVQEKIMTIDYFVYVQGFQNYNLSFATAVGVFRTIVSVSSLLIVNEIARKILGHRII